MSDKPDPKNLSSTFLSAALSVLVGSIALYLAVELMTSIVVPLVTIAGVLAALWLFVVLRRLRRPDQW